MTRSGKIARLPRDIREELNRRIQDGEPGAELVTWLDSLPEVNAVLKKQFNSQPINAPNLSEWREGGYRDWLLQQETKEFAANLAEEADELNAAGTALPTDKLAVWLTARFMTVVKRLDASSTDDAIRSKLLGEAATAFVALRRGEHSAERLKLARDRLGLERDPDTHDLEKLARKWAEEHNLEIGPKSHTLKVQEQAERLREIFRRGDEIDGRRWAEEHHWSPPSEEKEASRPQENPGSNGESYDNVQAESPNAPPPTESPDNPTQSNQTEPNQT